MKAIRSLSILITIASLCSCQKDANSNHYGLDEGNEAQVYVSLDFGDKSQTKSSNYVTAETYETQVNDVQVILFDEAGNLNAYVDADTETSGITIKTTTGSKTIWAVVNGPNLSRVTTLDELRNTSIDLGDNSKSADKGFVMAGSTSFVLGKDNSSVSISVSRFVARITLQTITCELPSAYGMITIKNVMLTNVVGNQNLAGDAAITTWYNKMGREQNNLNQSIIDGVLYQPAWSDLTFASLNESLGTGWVYFPFTPPTFYTYPNNTTYDVEGWDSTFTDRKTRLVVTAVIGSETYYYPIVLDSPARNTANTIDLTITGLGSKDPDEPVQKEALNVSVAIEEWASGTFYNETI